MDYRAAARTAVTRTTRGAARGVRDAFRHPGRPPLRPAARALDGARKGGRAFRLAADGSGAGGAMADAGQGAARSARWSRAAPASTLRCTEGPGQAAVVSRFEWGPDPGGGEVLRQYRSGGVRNSWGRDGARARATWTRPRARHARRLGRRGGGDGVTWLRERLPGAGRNHRPRFVARASRLPAPHCSPVSPMTKHSLMGSARGCPVSVRGRTHERVGRPAKLVDGVLPDTFGLTNPPCTPGKTFFKVGLDSVRQGAPPGIKTIAETTSYSHLNLRWQNYSELG